MTDQIEPNPLDRLLEFRERAARINGELGKRQLSTECGTVLALAAGLVPSAFDSDLDASDLPNDALAESLAVTDAEGLRAMAKVHDLLDETVTLLRSGDEAAVERAEIDHIPVINQVQSSLRGLSPKHNFTDWDGNLSAGETLRTLRLVASSASLQSRHSPVSMDEVQSLIDEFEELHNHVIKTAVGSPGLIPPELVVLVSETLADIVSRLRHVRLSGVPGLQAAAAAAVGGSLMRRHDIDPDSPLMTTTDPGVPSFVERMWHLAGRLAIMASIASGTEQYALPAVADVVRQLPAG